MMTAGIILIGALTIAWSVMRAAQPEGRLVIWIPRPLTSKRLLMAVARTQNIMIHTAIHEVKVSEALASRHFGELLAIHLGARIVWTVYKNRMALVRMSCSGHVIWVINQQPHLVPGFKVRQMDGISFFSPICRRP